MTPFDFAKRIIPVDVIRKNFVVALADEHWRLVLSMGPSAQRADQVALIARQVVAREIVRALASEDCRLAAYINDLWLRGDFGQRFRNADDICVWLRGEAELHTLDCIP